MKDELSYIDNITGDKLKEYSVTPKTSWELMNSRLTNVVAGNTFGGFLSVIGGFFTTKIFVVTVVILSIFTAGILISYKNSENGTYQKESFNDSNKLHEKSELYNNGKKIATGVVDDSLNNTHEAEESENVTIKVEVPVYKNVIVKKEIIIRDTINE